MRIPIKFLIPLLLQLLFFATEGARYPNCPPYSNNVTEFDKKYGATNTFYRIAQQISKGMQRSPNQGDMKRLASAYDAGISTFFTQDTAHLLRRQPGAIIFLIFGAIIVLCLPLGGFIFCCCRLCGRCGAQREHKKPSKGALCFYTFILFGSCAFVVAGCVLYGFSVHDANNTVDNLGEPLNRINNDVTKSLDDASMDISCQIGSAADNFTKSSREQLYKLPDTLVDRFKTDYGYNDLSDTYATKSAIFESMDSLNSSIKNATESLGKLADALAVGPNGPAKDNATLEVQNRIAQINNATELMNETSVGLYELYDQMLGILEKLNSSLDTFFTNMTQSLSTSDGELNKTRDSINQMASSMNDVLDKIRFGINQTNQKVLKFHDDITTSRHKTTLLNGLYAIGLVPNILVLLPGLLIFLYSMWRLQSDYYLPSKRTSVSNTCGWIALIGVTFGFLVGWVAMAVASIVFYPAYSLETICKPLFRDAGDVANELLVDYIPSFSYNVSSSFDAESNVELKFGKILFNCKHNATYYQALGGSSLLDTAAVLKMANYTQGESVAAADFTSFAAQLEYSYSHEKLETVETLVQQLQEFYNGFDPSLPQSTNIVPADAKTAEDALKKLKDSLQSLISTVNNTTASINTVIQNSSASGEFKNLSIVHDSFEKLRGQQLQNFPDVTTSLADATPACLPIYTTWKNIGNVYCNRIGRPFQGIWASVGLAALFLIPLILSLICISKYLFKARGPSQKTVIEAAVFDFQPVYAYNSNYTALKKPIRSSSSESPTEIEIPKVLPYLSAKPVFIGQEPDYGYYPIAPRAFSLEQERVYGPAALLRTQYGDTTPANGYGGHKAPSVQYSPYGSHKSVDQETPSRAQLRRY